MRRLLTACALVSAAHTAAVEGTAASAPGAPIVTTPPPLASQPPAGTKEDQALWSAGYETQTGALLEQDRARRAMLRLTTGGYYDVLAKAAQASPEARPAAEGAAHELAAAADEVARAGTKPPFDLRTGCRYQLLSLSNAMAAAQGPNGAVNLAAARAELSKCRDLVEQWRAPLARADDRLEKALDAADALLARRERSAAASRAAEGR